MQPRVIMHMDMDAFFASVEVARRPELANQPVVVGGNPEGRGVVAAANYEARKFGIHSALPMSVAKRRCPHLVVVRGDHGEYRRVSRQIMAIVGQYSSRVEQLSIDEAFLDLTDVCFTAAQIHKLVHEVRTRISTEFGLPMSVGVGESKFIAKSACTRAKPNGALYIPPEHSLQFIHSLELSDIWTVGPKTLEQLNSWGITTVVQLAEYPVRKLAKIIGLRHAHQLHDLVNNRDHRPVESVVADKSISNEMTFEQDRHTLADCNEDFQRLIEKTAMRLRQSAYLTKTIGIKVRDSQFRTITRSSSLQMPTDETAKIRATVHQLVDALDTPGPFRLIGVHLGSLYERQVAGYQDSLFDAGEPARIQKLDELSDNLRSKYGAQIVRSASSLHSPHRNSQ